VVLTTQAPSGNCQKNQEIKEKKEKDVILHLMFANCYMKLIL
jgi:hypothetical protein